MVRRQCVALLIATTTFLTLFCAFNPGVASSQEEAKNQKAPVEKAQPQVIVARGESGPGVDKPRAEVDKMIAAYDLKPHPPTPIPDDPPPHEGAMISIPYIVEPTDLVVVEVLNALEGRPISGERLLRPDGTISLGYYGEVYGKGLTTRQLKVAIIKHLRADLNDVALGLLEIQDGNVEVPTEMPVDRPNVPELPAGVNNPFNLDGDQKEQKETNVVIVHDQVATPWGPGSFCITIATRDARSFSAGPITGCPLRDPGCPCRPLWRPRHFEDRGPGGIPNRLRRRLRL